MKLTLQLHEGFDDDDLVYALQIGVRYVTVSTTGADLNTLRQVKTRIESAGLALTNIGDTSVHNMRSVTLGLPDRDQKIEEYLHYLANIAALGLTYTTYAHMANGIWQSSQPGSARGGALARMYEPETATGFWVGDEYAMTTVDGCEYSPEEIWANFHYFVKQVAPVAESLGINIGLHPDDPPGLTLGGVPRCVASSWEGYQQAFELANSPNLGICLCLGTWLEGGASMGCTPEEAIRGFAAQGRLWKVHFRNVDAPLPRFTETFIDAGYGDMRRYMRTLKEVGFNGIVIVDHVPRMVGDGRNPWSLSIGYMQGLMDELEVER
ncbi:mannonate dehydratase [Tessaracoccus antarcticus]|uniref:mannonate dehydratase n=1 Tax=Tessaracoccus antarcticus TaxID=2479848 RepID=A0A3M0G5R1_9ACTN|nr:mannonate dehydratase [Tessaracoccus antarcticus]RMB60225.1 D-mannonate dehydratase [Tessaracoccus antarcticus]